MIDRNGGWSLGFMHEQWKLTTGQAFPLTLTFDGQQPFNVHGVPIADKLVRVPMPSNSVAHRPIPKGEGDDGLYARPALPVQPRPDRTAIAGIGALRRQGQAIRRGQRRRFLGPSRRQAGRRGGDADSAPAKPDRLFDQKGTGFLVSTNGHLVTNAHVVQGCVGDIQGNLSGEAPAKLRLVSSDETNDLALLQATGSFKDIAKIRDKAIQSGDSVVAIGYPFHGLLTSDFTVTTGIVSSLSGILNDTRFLQISAAIQPGNSGGPLLASSGDVVGVVAAKLNAIKFVRATGNIPENINFAIKTGALRDFLDNSVVPYQISDAKAELKTADIARNARAIYVSDFLQGKGEEKEAAKNWAEAARPASLDAGPPESARFSYSPAESSLRTRTQGPIPRDPTMRHGG